MPCAASRPRSKPPRTSRSPRPPAKLCVPSPSSRGVGPAVEARQATSAAARLRPRRRPARRARRRPHRRRDARAGGGSCPRCARRFPRRPRRWAAAVGESPASHRAAHARRPRGSRYGNAGWRWRTHPDLTATILDHLGLASSVPPIAPKRSRSRERPVRAIPHRNANAWPPPTIAGISPNVARKHDDVLISYAAEIHTRIPPFVPVFAVSDGVVVYAGSALDVHAVALDHGDGHRRFYTGLTHSFVMPTSRHAREQRMKAGDVLGYSRVARLDHLSWPRSWSRRPPALPC